MSDEIRVYTEAQPPSRLPAMVKHILSAVFAIHFFIAMFCAFPYFSWQYMKEKSFMEWLVLGEIEPMWQSMIWEYYVFFDKKVKWSPEDKENISHFLTALDTVDVLMTEFANKDKSKQSHEEAMRWLYLVQHIIAEARLVDDAVLFKAHPDLPTHFRSEFQKSFEARLELKVGQAAIADQLYEKWAVWIDANFKKIKIPKRKVD
jgi:hypothetical protein